jgi:hypothetical protein
MARSRIVNLANFEQFTAINLLSDPGQVGGPVIVPSCAQIVLDWTLTDGKAAHNVLFGRYSGAFSGSPAQAQTIFQALASGSAFNGLAGVLSTTTTFASVTLRDVNTANQPLIQSSGGGVPGVGAGTALPDETALVVTLRTALAGRANRGRMYLPGFTATGMGAGNVVAPGVMTAVGTWAATIAGALAASGYVWVIGQKARNAYVGTTGTAHPARVAGSVPITGTVVRDNHWDSQRRRGLK